MGAHPGPAIRHCGRGSRPNRAALEADWRRRQPAGALMAGGVLCAVAASGSEGARSWAVNASTRLKPSNTTYCIAGGATSAAAAHGGCVAGGMEHAGQLACGFYRGRRGLHVAARPVGRVAAAQPHHRQARGCVRQRADASCHWRLCNMLASTLRQRLGEKCRLATSGKQGSGWQDCQKKQHSVYWSRLLHG